ncbi:transposase [Amycolatopsis sp. FDAARGOS 1241]
MTEIRWRLRTGALWCEPPEGYGHGKTARKRLRLWAEDGQPGTTEG